ncbi:MAG: hypothetical protein R2752_10945 [Vicinamibacterales bacterium]
MRGDSLRDLYAKSLALVGLGVLAGVGALVDYWPARVTVPNVDALVATPALARAIPVTEAAIPEPLPAASARPVNTPVATVASADAAPEPLVPAAAIPVSMTMAALTVGAPVELGAPPVRPFVAPPVTSVNAYEVPLSDPEDVLSPRFLAMAQAAQGTEDDGGFFSDATGFAKRAGSTILNTGTKAGASILGGLSFVGRSLKKLKIF